MKHPKHAFSHLAILGAVLGLLLVTMLWGSQAQAQVPVKAQDNTGCNRQYSAANTAVHYQDSTYRRAELSFKAPRSGEAHILLHRPNKTVVTLAKIRLQQVKPEVLDPVIYGEPSERSQEIDLSIELEENNRLWWANRLEVRFVGEPDNPCESGVLYSADATRYLPTRDDDPLLCTRVQSPDANGDGIANWCQRPWPVYQQAIMSVGLR